MTMSSVTRQRCLHHPLREAVARCVECHQSFCRECITEHDDRIVCSNCLKLIAQHTPASRWRWQRLIAPFQVAFGVMVAWLFFYFAGRVFVSIPTRYHEGTVWSENEAR